MDEQNKFYTSISEHYSQIFPFQQMQLSFVENRVGQLNGKKILDIGCATGELAYRLACERAAVTAIDLNHDLLEQAQTSKTAAGLKFQHGNMLEIRKDFAPESFDTVLCFGNTLVHLSTLDLIKQMLEGVFSVLKNNGIFLMQILNYDYILEEKITELPVIETDEIKFVRKYVFLENRSLLGFHTDLILKTENQSISNTTGLLALKSDELRNLLQAAGFTEIEFYSNFKMDAFGGKHLPLVVSCKK